MLADALEPECVATVGLGREAEPEPVHGFGLETGAEAETERVSWWSRQRKPAIPSYEPALLRPVFVPPAARTRRPGAGLVLETEESEMPEAAE